MEKPVSMRIAETREQLINACNESKLPICVLDMLVREVYCDVHRTAKQSAQEEAANYIQASLEEQNKEGEKTT